MFSGVGSDVRVGVGVNSGVVSGVGVDVSVGVGTGVPSGVDSGVVSGVGSRVGVGVGVDSGVISGIGVGVSFGVGVTDELAGVGSDGGDVSGVASVTPPEVGAEIEGLGCKTTFSRTKIGLLPLSFGSVVSSSGFSITFSLGSKNLPIRPEYATATTLRDSPFSFSSF